MNQIIRTHISCFLIIISALPCAVSQDFLKPDTGNDLERESMFIEAQSKIIIGDEEGAIGIYNQLLKKDVNDDEAAFFLGKIYFHNEDLSQSIKYFALALSNEKSNPWYYIWAADAYLKNKQFDHATRTIQDLITQFPDEKSYYDRLEYMLRDSKQYEKQIKLLDQMSERFGFHKNYALLKIQALQNNEEPDKALQLLKELTDRFPRDLFILNLLANSYENQGKEELAFDIYKKILEINPNDSHANLAVVDHSTDDSVDGSGKLVKMKDFFLNKHINFDTKFSEIIGYFQNDLNDLSTEEAKALDQVSFWLLESHSDNPKALSLRADILAQAGRNIEAVGLYQKTVAVHPDNYLVWEQLLWSLKELHRWKDLNQMADEASMYFPNKAAIYLLKGESEYHLGQWNDALFDLESSAGLSAQDPVMLSSTHALMALVKCSKSQSSNAKTAFSEARKILKNNPNIDYFESICELDSDRPDVALELIDLALQKVPDKSSYRVQKAKVLYQMANYEESLQVLLPLEGNTTYFPVYDWISKNYRQLDAADKASHYEEKAREFGAPGQNPIKN